MVAPTMPAQVTEVPGNFVTSALWNTQVGGLYAYTFNPPYFKGQATTAQSVASGTSWSAITLTSAVTDTEGGWSSGAPTIYTTVTPGRYLIICTLAWPAFTTSTLGCGVGISINGTTTRVTESPSAQTIGVEIQCSMSYFLSAGTTVGLLGMQNSGSSQNTQVGVAQLPSLEMIWLGGH